VRHLPIRRWPPLLTQYYCYNERKKELTIQSLINKLSGLENVAVTQAKQTLNTKFQYVGSLDINSTVIIINTDDITQLKQQKSKRCYYVAAC